MNEMISTLACFDPTFFFELLPPSIWLETKQNPQPAVVPLFVVCCAGSGTVAYTDGTQSPWWQQREVETIDVDRAGPPASHTRTLGPVIKLLLSSRRQYYSQLTRETRFVTSVSPRRHHRNPPFRSIDTRFPHFYFLTIYNSFWLRLENRREGFPLLFCLFVLH